jgi:protein-tyrosine phosphatase
MATIGDEAMLARRLPIAGTRNVRDIGGYATADGRSLRWKTLLRSDALHEVDDEGRGLLAGYGLRTAVDLREPAERERSPDRLHPDVRLISIPLFSYGRSGGDVAVDPTGFSSLDEVYRYVVNECGPAVVAALQALAGACQPLSTAPAVRTAPGS